jgi:p-methyltransferase
VYFTDDNLFSSRTRARDICRAILDSGMQVRWRGMVRVTIVDDETAALMAQSGCLEVLLGIESGDPDILRSMGKDASPERILEGIRRLSRAGINTKSTFIVGYPGETDASLQRTVDLLNAYPTDGPAVHRYLFFRFGVLPLSKVASPESRARFHLRGYGYHWTHDTMTSQEAEQRMEALYDRLKVELSPSYVLEVPELPGMTVDRLKQAFVSRNHLARLRRGLPAPSPGAQLWDELQDCFETNTPSAPAGLPAGEQA